VMFTGWCCEWLMDGREPSVVDTLVDMR